MQVAQRSVYITKVKTIPMNPILILTNCPSSQEADNIAAALLEQELAAAAQIIGPTTSRYRWQGEVHHQQEWLLVIKTSGHCEAQIKNVIGQLHSYELPGMLTLDIAGGNERYLQWIVNNVTAEDRE